ncbi:MAG: hypothetical protein LBH29_01890 [Elusimicrobiota bacterium]|jgi:hypothetical protein|nr:hypothetical protein [Elusimicrobiota bacterium]
MTCDELTNEIILYYSNELPPEKVEEYKRHTMICRQCARFSFDIREAIQYIQDYSPKIEKIDLLLEDDKGSK